jgi:SulP family sulfate permease
MFSRALGQVSSGLILGLTAVIYAVSYAALMFSGPLAVYVPYALTVTLITAAIGGLYGLFTDEPTLVSGPDSNTTSVLAGMLLASVAVPLPGVDPLHRALGVLLGASIVTAAVYLLMERFNAGRLVRYIPFQVMAGFLASTGRLMSSGALNLIGGTPLSLNGLLGVIDQPRRPELALGIGFALMLFWLNRRFRAAVVIPVFMIASTVVLNVVLRGLLPASAVNLDAWFFKPFSRLQWLPPWSLDFSSALLVDLARLVPGFLVVAFVGALTVLLSLSSLELTYRRDFALEPALRLHGRITLATAALGGYLGLISIGRSAMCKSTGGGRWTGLVIAGVCVGMLFGGGAVIAWIPKVSLGALVLYLGLGMLKQWVWDLRTQVARAELLEVLAIVVCVAIFGYLIGFAAGLLLACIIFVLNYSRLPHVRTDATLASLRSSVIRPLAQQQLLTRLGERCRVGRFDGYIFFGVANSIYEWYGAAPRKRFDALVLDFTGAKGMDPSAAAVLKKIIRTQGARKQILILCASAAHEALLQQQTAGDTITDTVRIARNFDTALELAEDHLLAHAHSLGEDISSVDTTALAFLDTAVDQTAFSGFLQRRELQKGDQLFAEGSQCAEMFFLDRGSLDVVRQGLTAGSLVRLAKVTRGAMIGEMALYSGQPRAATIVAAESATLLVLDKTNWERLRHERPDLCGALDRRVIACLIDNVRRTNATLAVHAS